MIYIQFNSSISLSISQLQCWRQMRGHSPSHSNSQRTIFHPPLSSQKKQKKKKKKKKFKNSQTRRTAHPKPQRMMQRLVIVNQHEAIRLEMGIQWRRAIQTDDLLWNSAEIIRWNRWKRVAWDGCGSKPITGPQPISRNRWVASSNLRQVTAANFLPIGLIFKMIFVSFRATFCATENQPANTNTHTYTRTHWNGVGTATKAWLFVLKPASWKCVGEKKGRRRYDNTGGPRLIPTVAASRHLAGRKYTVSNQLNRASSGQ